MTDQHPLTDETCEGLVHFRLESQHDYIMMRTAADWQLEQVIKWLRENLDERYIWADVCPPGVDTEEVITDIKLELRPQEQE